jgi:hypothetical protein
VKKMKMMMGKKKKMKRMKTSKTMKLAREVRRLPSLHPLSADGLQRRRWQETCSLQALEGT